METPTTRRTEPASRGRDSANPSTTAKAEAVSLIARGAK